MADAYVDLTNGADVNDGLTWANAEKTFQAGIDTAGSGGRCFVQIDTDDVATTKDTAVATRILDFPGTDQVPFGLYGVKNGTTAEPPTDSDLCVRGTDALPVFAATGATNDLTIDETTGSSEVRINIHGIRFEADDQLKIGGAITCYCSGCELAFDRDILIGSGTELIVVNCDLIFEDQFSRLSFVNAGDVFLMLGGIVSGTAPDFLMDGTPRAQHTFHGVDLSIVVASLFDFSNTPNGFAKFINCKMGTGFTRATGIASLGTAFVELIGCSNETGLGSGESVRDYAKEYYRGTILSEATIIRTGGANDGVAGFSYALKPRAASTKESLLGLDTPWFGGIVEGDGSTSKDFTVYIANDSGSDLTEADVWLELFTPSAAGVTQHDFDISSRAVIDASASNVADDTASDWSTGAGGKNAQKIVITATPDFTGPVYGRVIFAQQGTVTCYVDPKVYVTNT